MDLLNLFRECVYPSASLRTESIDSIDQPCPGYRFRACNINDDGQELVYGEIQLTRTELIFYPPGVFPTRWPIQFIRRFGCDENSDIFSFESGRRCKPSGIFAFKVEHASELIAALRSVIDNARGPYDQYQRIIGATKITRGDSSTNAQEPHLDPKPSEAATSINKISSDNHTKNDTKNEDQTQAGPRILYTEIDFGMTKALSSSAAEHAAAREEVS